MSGAARQLTICGGGLAGLALGNAVIRRGHAVQIFEKESYPRHRVCGEFICGVEDATLERLGILPDLEDGNALHSMTWWHQDREILHETLTLPARGISRHRLDHRLARRFTSQGGQLACNTRCLPDTQPSEGVVWTTGRPKTPRSRWIGLKHHQLKLELHSDLEMHLGPGGYVGLSRIEEDKVNLCGLFEVNSGLRQRMPQLLRCYLERMGAQGLIERIDKATTDPASCCAVAGFAMGTQSGPDHLLRIGDAQLMIPPFTGNGMSMAFESAELLADALLPWLRGEACWSDANARAQADLTRHFRKRMRLAQMLHRPLLHPLLQRLTSHTAAAGLLPTQWLFRQLRS